MNKKSPPKKKTPSRPRKKAAAGPRAIESLMAQLVGQREDSPLEAAQELMWDAFDTPDRRKRVALAKKALELSPLCADAYVLLGREAARNVDEALKFYRDGVAAGEKALGKAAFRDDVGHFWGILETRPYMRARHCLAMALWESGARDEAVAHYQDMLRLNPGDNQGLRYILLDCLLTLGRDEEVAMLLQRYKNDGAAAWKWSEALAAFRREGDSVKSRKALAAAAHSNVHVASYLVGKKKLPRDPGNYISMGGEDEAISYVTHAAAAWAAAPGALAWTEAALRAAQGKGTS